MKLPQEIEQYLIDYLSGNLSEHDKEYLDTWINKSGENKLWFGEFAKSKNILNNLTDLDDLRHPRYWLQMQQKIQQSGRHFFLRKLTRIAAVIFFPLALAAGLYYMVHTAQKAHSIMQLTANTIQPGSKKAVLVLSDGKTVDLGDTDLQLEESNGTRIIAGNQSNGLVYSNQKNTPKALIYNTLSIPRGGEYFLQLSDGTRVWLNSCSKLRFPVEFATDKREVWVEGEAYFEVKHNPGAPFTVRSKHMDATVLGTSFNISTYEDDSESHLTLVSGSVNVQTEGKNQQILRPGYQLKINNGDGFVNVREVNTSIYTAWKDGVLLFNNENMESIMRKLGRWYDVNTRFGSAETKNVVFYGKVKRYETIDKIMELIKLTEKIDYSITDKVITINKR
jgi:transmembrane sensor